MVKSLALPAVGLRHRCFFFSLHWLKDLLDLINITIRYKQYILILFMFIVPWLLCKVPTLTEVATSNSREVETVVLRLLSVFYNAK